ncbi:hypothetical protein AcV5_007698 [Taiwanofungus camphoratus]|nr:hypothetical protein AcV5_007698 [Antrodia cinnamomea]
MSTAQDIIFYDIPSNSVKNKAWSPNTWKTRFALNYKGLPYKTVWVEYPDIAGLCKEIGAAPTDTYEDGSPAYTLPAIYDPSTKMGVAESGIIARYLDKTYPNTPVLIPEGSDAFHAAFQEAFLLTIQRKMLPIMLLATTDQLNSPSAAYFRRTREATYGKMEELSPAGPVRDGQWEELRAGFTKVAEWMSMDGKDKPFFMGDTICHADLSIAGWLMWMKRVLGSGGPEWAAVKTWNEGKWAAFMDFFETYEIVDD